MAIFMDDGAGEVAQPTGPAVGEGKGRAEKCRLTANYTFGDMRQPMADDKLPDYKCLFLSYDCQKSAFL